MNWKDYLRITSLGAAIALGMLVHSAQHDSAPQADSWAGPIERIKPVHIETVTLPAASAFSA